VARGGAAASSLGDIDSLEQTVLEVPMRHPSGSSQITRSPVRGRRQLARRRRVPALAVMAALAAGTLTGCQDHASFAPTGAAGNASTSSSEAQRTQEMEKKAKDIEQQARDLQNMQGTEQEKIDAANKIEQQRQELNRQSEAAPAAA
jgi:hypothetical protein